MENIEYMYIVKELQHLKGKYFSKFKQVDVDTFVLTIGDNSILIQLGVRLHTTKYLLQEEIESAFAATTRQLLKNQKLTELYQHDDDRVIVFQFNSKSLIFEMFAKGNAILVEDGTIMAAFKEESWADRTIKKKEKYIFPRSNIKHNIKETLSDRFIISCLLTLPLGKEYAKELLVRCKIPERKPGNELSEQEIKCLEREYEKMRASLQPYVFCTGQKVLDYGLTNFSNYNETEQRCFASFNEALDFYYWNAEKKESERITKLRARIEKQKKALEELKAEEKRAQLCGDFIYLNYELIDRILSTAKESNIDEVEEKLKEFKAKINKKEKEIEIEI
jgi:predicted ribosome quality control (RQC) complex YloA/Tae2 family protein